MLEHPRTSMGRPGEKGLCRGFLKLIQHRRPSGRGQARHTYALREEFCRQPGRKGPGKGVEAFPRPRRER